MFIFGEDIKEASSLWSNNPNLVEIVQNCFETMWNKANESKPEQGQ
jgi:hypothetical protein